MEKERYQTIGFLFWEIFLSTIIFFLGIFYSSQFYHYLERSNDLLPKQSMITFLGSMILGTITIILIVTFLKRKKKIKKNIYKFIFIIANIYGALSILPLLFNTILPGIWSNGIALLITIIATYSWLKKPTILNHNFLMVLGLSGVGGLLGLELQDPRMIALLLAILTTYDFIAVYKTKHMVKMAESMIESRTIIGLIIPSKKEDFVVPVPDDKNRGRFMIIGGGDIAIPLMLVTSFIPLGLDKALIVSVFSILGIIFSFFLFYFQEEKQAMPALPAISLMSLVGCLLAISL